ncbi:MAG TPA: Ldh family oxidoreductase [Candidatus Dojkabacteria bacterium]|nr:Ldh family oxidoreductase [Candidatus Dojkabacteria bacterium]
MKISLTELQELVNKALVKYGYNDEEVKVLSEILMYAQMRGNNQGIVKLIGNGIPKNMNGKPYEVVKDTPVSALVNGNYTHAMVVMDAITDLAIEKAKASGIGIVGNNNTAESTGAIGYYASKIAKAGFIGLAFSSAPFQTTAPHGSTEALFCTNPLAYAIPMEDGEIVFDMTTSAVAYYGLIEAKTQGTLLADNYGYDADGNDTNDPVKIMGGAIKTMAGHKGSGLALLVQVLAGSLVGAESFNSSSDNGGNLVIAIDPNILSQSDDFKKDVTNIVKRIKSSKPVNTENEVMYPGERGNQATKNVIDSGYIEVEDNLLNELKKVVG